jgi:hypothetical protein
MHKVKERFLLKSELKNKDWTESLIKEFLPEPDKISPNPKYKSAAPMLLYLEERVKGIEASETFKTQYAKAEKRKQAAHLAIETKKQKLIEYVQKIELIVRTYLQKELTFKACKHYNCRNEWKAYDYRCNQHDDYTPASVYSNTDFLMRITENFIRHQLSNYEAQLSKMAKNIGLLKEDTQEAYTVLRQCINEAIAKKYPFLRS